MGWRQFIERIKRKRVPVSNNRTNKSPNLEPQKEFLTLHEHLADIDYTLTQAQILINNMNHAKNKKEMEMHFENFVSLVLFFDPNILLKEKAGQNFVTAVASMNKEVKSLKGFIGLIKQTLETKPLDQKKLKTWIGYTTNALVLIRRELERIDKNIKSKITTVREAA